MIRRLREHQRWVAMKLLDAARPLVEAQRRQPFAIGMGTLWDTLVHLYAAEFIWLAAIEGNPTPPGPREITFGSLAELEVAWQALSERWSRFVDALSEADLDRPVRKISTSAGAGSFYTTPMSDVLLHLATHAAHTTAQALNMLRQLGVKPPDAQLMTMARIGTEK